MVSRIAIGLAGMCVLLAFAVLLSSNRRAIRLRVVGPAFGLQVLIAILVLYVPAGRAVLTWLSQGVGNLLSYADAGTSFLFGPLANDPLGRFFALQALPVIIFFSSLISILYYLRIMPLVIHWIGGGLEKLTGISKVEALNAAANIFVGQSEAPLVIRPYLAGLTPPQLFMVMTSGMAGVAGTMLAAYAAMGVRLDYLLAASFMSAPAGILMAKIIMPDPRATAGDLAIHEPVILPIGQEDEPPANLIMAAAQGALTGLKLAAAVAAMVFAFVALMALANGMLTGIGGWFGLHDLTFQRILGYIFSPVMFLLNVPWRDAQEAGGLLGQKVVLNEFVAYISLGAAQKTLAPVTVGVVTFALCGFANFSSIAIQLAVTGVLAPNQRPMIARLGVKALVAGTLANLMSATLAGILLPV
jgi:CNT family concentrative nucleoside transporter